MCRKAKRKSQKLSPLLKIAENLHSVSSPLKDKNNNNIKLMLVNYTSLKAQP